MTKTRTSNQKDHLLTEGISLKSLFCLLNTSDENIITNSLLKRKSELEQLTKSNLKSEELIDLLKILVNVYNLKNHNVRSQLLAITHSEEFISNIKDFLLCSGNNGYLKEVIDSIIYFVDVNINELPISNVYYNRFYSLLKVLHGVKLDGDFSYVYLWMHELSLLLQKKLIHGNRTNYIWKELNIHPSAVDLYEKKDLMPNKINGAYKKTEEYLDTMFKLLKEDYEGNLREGMLQMKAELRGAKTTNKDISVYNNVNIECVEIDRYPTNGIIHRIAFSIGGNENQFYNVNKPFKHGSLLCFSLYSQFTTFILATVVEDVALQNSENNSYKVLKVSFVGDISQIKPYWKYTMIESKKFFEPYYHVLKVIQSKSIENFPMKKYIIYLDTSPCVPGYISTDTEYKIDCKSIKLFSKVPWPSNLLNLDPSQVEALQAALTYEFVLIQGPPGSGKTHLAQTIINILIDNKSFLSTPILLISSNNNAVDFILESLALKKRNVMRLGNQTESVILKKHLLSNMIKRTCGRDIKLKIDRIKKALLRKLNQNEADIEKLVDCLKREQSLYMDMCDEDVAHKILSAKVDLIGGTTAVCARLQNLLEKLQPEVVIVENANEVLEAHIVTALSQGCKHVILIGDHKQLKPNISNRHLENYDFDVSLFERMMRCGMKCCTLKEQHRMRPEIASLVYSTAYQMMKHQPVVKNLTKIRGMKHNLFFIDHEVAENKKKDEENSYSNRHEGDTLLSLANYLILQGYSLKELTILVPYAGQLKYMIGAAGKYPLLKNVEILTIDKYSGHENKIILLSLVRSHSAGIGFLSNSNKIVVALSRAKSGLYIIGNMKTLMSGSDLWISLNTVLKKNQVIGKHIELECITHKKVTAVSKKQDFKLLEFGGCTLQCNLPLDCGHLCKLKCHPLLEEHAAYICSEPCSRFCERKLHKCKKNCSEECGKCNEDVDIILSCGHSSKKKCCVNKEEKEICMLPYCQYGKSFDLEYKIQKKIMAESTKKDFNPFEDCWYNSQCNLPLDCGHFCKLEHHPLEEHAGYICSEPCLRFCERNLHKCKKNCSEECGQCNEDVEVMLPCGHSLKKKCCADQDEKEICMQPVIVSYLCCMRKVVPCWESSSCFYRKVEGPV